MQEFFLSTILSEGWNMTGIGHLGWHLKIINICLWLLLTEEEFANCWKWEIAWSGCHLMKNSLYVGSKVCRSRHLGSMVLVSFWFWQEITNLYFSCPQEMVCAYQPCDFQCEDCVFEWNSWELKKAQASNWSDIST